MLEAGELEPDRQIAFITHRAVYITAEKVAINAVMAGCRPEYMPVVVAAVEGIGDPRWSYHGPGTSTGGAAVLMIVNGPIARELDINAGDNLFGPGWRANLTIGRAVRLVMRNVCGSMPGLLDRGTLGHPGQALVRDRRERGREPVDAASRRARLPPEQSAVTVVAAAARGSSTTSSRTRRRASSPRSADDMRISGNMMGQANYVVVLAGEHMRTIAASGWDKAESASSSSSTRRTHTRISSAPSGCRARSPRRTSTRCDRWWRRPTTSSWWRRAAGPARSPATSRAGAVPRTRRKPYQGGQAMIEVLDPTVEALTQTIEYVAAAERAQGQACRAGREHEVQLRQAAARRSATSSRPSTVWPRRGCGASTTRACPPTPRSSTR